MIETPVLERVLSEALRNGGDFAEVFAEDRSNSSALLDDKRVEELSSGRERGAGIRVVSGETTGFAHTADLSEAGLLRAAEAASAVARGGGGGTRTVALGPPATAGRPGSDGGRPPASKADASSCSSGPTRPPGRPGPGSPRSRPGSARRPGGC